ncbi:MAG: hemN [Herbaspirillum sp.]|nr:hemN [Herbaspirillum sp.]
MAAPVLPIASVQPIQFDADLIRRLGHSGPRYTSYPTADKFTEAFGYRDYLQTVAGLHSRIVRNPLSLYVHVPFCDTVCYFCACNKIVTKNRDKAETYLAYLKREIDMQGRLLAGMNQMEQLHLGGGTPTYLSHGQMDELLAHLRQWFDFAPDPIGEYSIEADPRCISEDRVRKLREQGFNRISLGVQDFDPEVQKAVNRTQPEHQTLTVIAAARDAGYRSVNVDLIYGLPKQSVISMARTLAKVIQAGPDRIAVYNYAHLPHLFKMQRPVSSNRNCPAPKASSTCWRYASNG